MFKKLSLVMVLVLIAAITVVRAADLPPTPEPPLFTDGRLNAYDAAAPIVIYEPRVRMPFLQDNGLRGLMDTVGSVEILRWDGATESSSLALRMSVDAINAAIAKNPNTNFVITTQHGVSLGYSHTTGQLWVTAAPDFEGKTYTFVWEKNF